MAVIRRTPWLCWQGNEPVNQTAIFIPWTGRQELPSFQLSELQGPLQGPSQGHPSGIACDSWMPLSGNCQLRIWVYQHRQHTVLRGPTPHEKWESIWGRKSSVVLGADSSFFFFKNQLYWDIIYVQWKTLILSVQFNVLAYIIHPCNHHHNHNREHFDHPSKCFPCPLRSVPPTSPQLQATTAFCHCRLVLPIQEL